MEDVSLPDCPAPGRRTPLALAVDLCLCACWIAIAVVTFRNWLKEWPETHQLKDLGIFFVNSTYAYLFIARKPSTESSKLAFDWVVTVMTIVASFMLQLMPGAKPIAPYAYVKTASVVLQTLMALVLFASVCSLGRSFGLVPANRGVKVGGMYAYMRHPLYGTQLLFYCAYLVGNFSPFRLVLLAAIFVGMNLRARAEERLLASDPDYQHYMEQVRYRFIPGLI